MFESSIATTISRVLSYNCVFVMSSPVNTEEAASSDINDILGRCNIVWRDGDEISPDPRLEWDYEEDEDVPGTDGGILLSLAVNDEANPPDQPLQPGTTPIVGHLVRETWRAKWTGMFSPTDGLQLQVGSMNDSMADELHEGHYGSYDLTLYSKDDNRFAFLRGEFDISWTDCGGTYDAWTRVLAKKNGPTLRLTESERQRCKDLLEQSEEEEDEDEDEEEEGEESFHGRITP